MFLFQTQVPNSHFQILLTGLNGYALKSRRSPFSCLWVFQNRPIGIIYSVRYVYQTRGGVELGVVKNFGLWYDGTFYIAVIF